MKILKLLILSLLVAGCGYAPMDYATNHCIINKIEINNDGTCSYFGNSNGEDRVLTATEKAFMFVDYCGKFQIGDTVKIVKK